MQLEYCTPSEITIPDGLSQHIYPLSSYLENDCKICLIGIEEYRGNEANKGCETGPDKIREQLFNLKNFPKIKIVDAGNIEMGASYGDTHFAMISTINEILKNKLIPIILGGDKTLLSAQEKAYHHLDFSFINVIHIDEEFEIGNDLGEEISQNNYLDYLLKQDPNLIFNFIQLGYQSYLVDQLSLDIIKKMDFESYRLGSIKSDIKEIEPIVRDGDLMAFNVSALSYPDGSGYFQPSPNGFSAIETCQIMRYAGMSDRLTSVAFYGYNPKYDQHHQTAQVLAQAIWYFIQGVTDRKIDYPILYEDQFNKYVVSSKEMGYDITFLKSIKSDRWWIKIPDQYIKYKSHQLFPCSYKDYLTALNEEIPERLWKAFNKLV